MRDTLALVTVASVAFAATASTGRASTAGFYGNPVYAGVRASVGGTDLYAETETATAGDGAEFTNFSAGGWLVSPMNIDFTQNTITIEPFGNGGSFVGDDYGFHGLVFGFADGSPLQVKGATLGWANGFSADEAGDYRVDPGVSLDLANHEIRVNLAGDYFVPTASISLDVSFEPATPVAPAPVPAPDAAAAGAGLLTLLALARRRPRAA